MQEIVVTT